MHGLGDESAELTHAELRRAVEEAGGIGAKTITLSGGEPLMRKECLDLIRFIKATGLEGNLITNGTLIDEHMSEELISSNVDRIAISLDALGEKQDRIRGVQGTFDKIKSSIDFLVRERARQRKSMPFITAHMTISNMNIDELLPLASFTRESGLDKFTFQYISETPPESVEKTVLDGQNIGSSRFTPHHGSLLPNIEQAKKLKQILSQIEPSFYARFLINLSDEELAGGVFPVRKCYYTRNAIVINPYGDVHLCPHIDKYIIGNIRRDPLESISGNEKHKILTRALGKNLFPVCRYCCMHVHNMTPWQVLGQFFEGS